MNSLSGIPPHVKMISQLSEMLELLKAERIEKASFNDKTVKEVKESIETHAFSNGHLTHDYVLKLFENHQSKVNHHLNERTTTLSNKIDHLLQVVRGQAGGYTPNSLNSIENDQGTDITIDSTSMLHQWDGKFWHVTKCFKFPRDVRRKRGWDCG